MHVGGAFLRRALAFALVAVFMGGFVMPTQAGHDEPVSPSTHWLSLINMTHRDPSDMTVIIMPPGYVAYYQTIQATGWASTTPVYDLPATQATLEAVEYWDWVIDQYAAEYPNAQVIDFEVKVFGHDADHNDVSTADIIINTAMTATPWGPNVFHLGIGMPTYPLAALWSGHGNQYQTKCTVWNTGMIEEKSAHKYIRLRNLVIHEFGHCLAVGHTGTSLNFAHTDRHGTVFDQHPTDVMSSVSVTARQCISNLNVQSLDEGYTPFATTGDWGSHDTNTYMKKSDYEVKCLPTSMQRF